MLYSPKAQTGIPSRECACGAHCFAYPYDARRETWNQLSAGRYRQKLIDAGVLSPEPPKPEPHVILVSPGDRDFFKLRRWCVVRSPKGKLNHYEVKRRARGCPLHKMLMPDAPVVQFVNRDGCDCRRENLVETTMKSVCRARYCFRDEVAAGNK